MKVAIINPFGNTSGHSLNYSSKLCYGLAKQDIQLTLFTSADYDPSVIFGESLLNYNVVRNTVKKSTLTKNYKSKYSLVKYGISMMSQNWKALKEFRIKNKSEKFDIVHIIGGEILSSILFFLFSKKINSQVILTIHNSDFGPDLYIKTSKLKHYYKQFLKYILHHFYFNRFSKIMVHGEQMKLDLLEQIKFKNPDRIYPINIGIDVNPDLINSNNAKQTNKLTILFFGVIRQDKGLQILLEALRKINNNDFILNVYGKPTELKESEIIELVNASGKKECINLDLRYFDENEINNVFNSCDFVILPYRKTFKAQSVVLTLAAAHKRTLICSNTGQNGYDVEKYKLGYTFESENVKDLANILNGITSGKYQPIKDLAVFDYYINENSWSNMGKKIYQMYID